MKLKYVNVKLYNHFVRPSFWNLIIHKYTFCDNTHNSCSPTIASVLIRNGRYTHIIQVVSKGLH